MLRIEKNEEARSKGIERGKKESVSLKVVRNGVM